MPKITRSPTGRLVHREPEFQNLPGTPAARLEAYFARHGVPKQPKERPMQITTDNGITLIFDTSLDETARAIFEINQGGHPSVESVRDYILASAKRWVNKPTIAAGTGGWYVVALPWESDPPGTLHATCVVMAYSVNAYLKSQAEERRDLAIERDLLT